MTRHILFGLFFLLQNAALPQQPGSVQGMVIEAGTGRPLQGVTVQLRGFSVVIAADTRADGTFALRNVPAGTYQIEALRAGYIPLMYRDQPEAIPRTHTIAPGQSLSAISIMLTPGAVIYGRLIDDKGEAVVGAPVEALKTTYRNGQRERTRARATITNDLGEYRLFMLPPGEYVVRATPPSFEIERPPFNKLHAIPLYFPGTIDSKESRNIELRSGEILGGVDFLSFPTRARRVTGNVLGMGGEAAGVLLFPRNGTAAMERTVDPATGAFEFKDVLPGPYLLLARSNSRSAALSLDVANVDVLDLRMTLGSGYKIPAQVHIEGHAAGNDPGLEKLYFTVQQEPPIPGIEVPLYSPFSNGRFVLDVLSGDYRIDLERPDDFYIKSMTVGGIDVLNQGLRVSGSSDAPLEILVGTNPGSVEGQTSAGGVTVVLVPDADRRGQRGLYKAMKAGSSGEFRFGKVPPGDYKLFAWQAENGGPWLDPDYLSRYENRGIPIRVEAGKRTQPGGLIPLLD